MFTSLSFRFSPSFLPRSSFTRIDRLFFLLSLSFNIFRRFSCRLVTFTHPLTFNAITHSRPPFRSLARTIAQAERPRKDGKLKIEKVVSVSSLAVHFPVLPSFSAIFDALRALSASCYVPAPFLPLSPRFRTPWTTRKASLGSSFSPALSAHQLRALLTLCDSQPCLTAGIRPLRPAHPPTTLPAAAAGEGDGEGEGIQDRAATTAAAAGVGATINGRHGGEGTVED
jgi:hypothetical protein